MLMLLLTIFAAQAAAVRASSTHRDADGSDTAAPAFDGSFRTGWAESKPGSTEGEWLEIDLGQSTQIDQAYNCRAGAPSARNDITQQITV